MIFHWHITSVGSWLITSNSLWFGMQYFGPHFSVLDVDQVALNIFEDSIVLCVCSCAGESLGFCHW